MGTWEQVRAGLQEFANVVAPAAVSLTGIAILSMAALQVLKDIFHVHRRFNGLALARWLEAQAKRAGARFGKPPSIELARETLVTLATGGDAAALHALDTPQLTAQMSAASQIVIDNAALYDDLFRCLAAEARPEDVIQAMSPPPPMAPDATGRGEATAWVEARNRVTHQIQRTLDGLQIALDYRWTYVNRLVVFALNAVFAVIALRLANVPGGLLYLTIPISAAFLAPVAKDVVTALQGLRDRLA